MDPELLDQLNREELPQVTYGVKRQVRKPVVHSDEALYAAEQAEAVRT